MGTVRESGERALNSQLRRMSTRTGSASSAAATKASTAPGEIEPSVMKSEAAASAVVGIRAGSGGSPPTGIGVAGSASLAVVAPGIAEALIATAVGLFAAIPATIFYNVFVAKLRELNEAIDLYSAELEGDLRRCGPSAETPAQVMGG